MRVARDRLTRDEVTRGEDGRRILPIKERLREREP